MVFLYNLLNLILSFRKTVIVNHFKILFLENHLKQISVWFHPVTVYDNARVNPFGLLPPLVVVEEVVEAEVVVKFVYSFDGVEGPVRKNAIRVISKTKLKLKIIMKAYVLKSLYLIWDCSLKQKGQTDRSLQDKSNENSRKFFLMKM